MLILSISMNVKLLIFLIGFTEALGRCSMLQYIQQAEKKIFYIFSPFGFQTMHFKISGNRIILGASNIEPLSSTTFEYKNKIYTFSPLKIYFLLYEEHNYLDKDSIWYIFLDIAEELQIY